MFKSALPDVLPNFAILPSGKNIPSLNVPIPTESTLITSSYVRVPPIETLPEKFAVPNVVIPVALKLRAVISPVVMLSFAVRATLPVRP